MDLYAYANMLEDEKIKKIIEKNGIDIPRPRGYRLMSLEEEAQLTEEDEYRISIETAINFFETRFLKGIGRYFEFSEYTKSKCRWYIENYDNRYDMYGDNYTGPMPRIRFERMGRKRRRMLKTMIRNKINRYKYQYNIFNKYVGRKDILYAHARIGGGNWEYYSEYVLGKPWFVEKVDDAGDSTYCDIYCKIGGDEE